MYYHVAGGSERLQHIGSYFRSIDEIDFLRVLAVICVVSNHILGLKGGFIGVDVDDYWFLINSYKYHRHLSNKTLLQHRKEHSAVNEILYSVNSSDIVIADPASILCPNGICKWRDGVDLFYKDDDHLSVYGADLIMPLIIRALDNYQ